MAKLVWGYSDDARATIENVYKSCKEQKNNIRIELKQRIGYTGSKGCLRKDLIHMKFTYTRCRVNRKVLMERQDVVLSRIRNLRRVRELREAGYTVAYTDETYVHTSHIVPKCWQDSTIGLKIPFSIGNLRIVELHDPWVCTIITILVRPLVKKHLIQEYNVVDQARYSMVRWHVRR